MKNYIQKGGTVSVIAPYLVTSGQGVLVGALFGIASHNAAQGAPVEIVRTDVFDVSAVTADTAAQGAKIYWDNTARKLTTTATNNTLVGCVTEAKANGDITARVLLDGAVR